MPIDDTMLDSKRGLDVPVRKGRLCGGCGYSLDGLMVGQPCPECGKKISPNKASNTRGDTLTAAGVDYLVKLRPSALGLAGSAVLLVVGLFLTAFAPALGALVALAAGGLWLVSVWFITNPKPVREGIAEPPKLEMRRTRMAARWSQFGWGTFAILILVALPLPGVLQTAVLTLAQGALLVAVGGLIPLSAWLAELSDWGRDEPLGQRFRAAAWLLALLGITYGVQVLQLVGVHFGLFQIIAIWAMIGALVGFVLLLVCLLQLASLVQNAISSAIHLEQREERIKQKKLEKEHQSGHAPPGEIRRPAGRTLPCRECGYDLTGLPSDVPCPECGTRNMVAFSTGQQPRIAPPPKLDQTPIELTPEPDDPPASEPEPSPGPRPAARPRDGVDRPEDVTPYDLADD